MNDRDTFAAAAWAVIERDGFDIEGLFPYRDDAVNWCGNRQQIVPLYRHPQPTLTDEEREAIEGVIAVEHQRGAWKWADTLSKLLARLA